MKDGDNHVHGQVKRLKLADKLTIVGVALVDGELRLVGGAPEGADGQLSALLAGGLMQQAQRLASV